MRQLGAARTPARIRSVPAWSRVAVLCAAAWSANCHAIEPVPDNVVLITLDTTRADRLPAYGFQGVSTPALDRLAAEGIVFEDAVAQVPLTLPSHASMLTGRWPARHGIRDNADAALAPAELTLAEVLAERGVRTSAFVASVVLQSGRGLEQGFGTYVDVPKGLCGPGTLQRQRRPGDAVVDDALAWIDHNAERPFFTWVHLYDAHRPYTFRTPRRPGMATPISTRLPFKIRRSHGSSPRSSHGGCSTRRLSSSPRTTANPSANTARTGTASSCMSRRFVSR